MQMLTVIINMNNYSYLAIGRVRNKGKKHTSSIPLDDS